MSGTRRPPSPRHPSPRHPLRPCSRLRALAALLGALALPQAATANEDWALSADATLYGYANTLQPAHDSVQNPDNRIARLARDSLTFEGRFNLKAERGPLRLTARPIVHWQHDNQQGSGSQSYLSQWQLRWRAGTDITAAIGRETLSWGPAQFRSPSNPYYFDNGRSNPIRELSGVDVARLIWAPDVTRSVYLARIASSGHDAARPDPWADSWLLKADLRSDDLAAGLALAGRPQAGHFIGAHLQHTVSDEWLLYGEFGSSTLTRSLRPAGDAALPVDIADESPRHSSWLLGASYTLENGHSLTAEYLRYGHGYDGDARRSHFRRAAAATSRLPAAEAAQTLGAGLGAAPPLLGRDYLHLIWQNSPLSDDGYWRLMLSHSLADGSAQGSLFAERPLSRHVTAFVLGTVPVGGRGTEFGDLFDYSLTLGARIALP